MIRELPNAQRMEQSLLGSLLVFPEVISLCRDADLSATEFFVPAHQKIYDAILEVADEGQAIDFERILQRLTENGDESSSGGLEYLSQLMDAAVSGAAAASYIETIQNKSQLRRLIETSDKIAEQAGTSNAQIDTILDRCWNVWLWMLPAKEEELILNLLVRLSLKLKLNLKC